MFVQPHTVAALPQDGQRRLAHLNRFSAKVITIQLQQVESV
jgi:hypothetical protein